MLYSSDGEKKCQLKCDDRKLVKGQLLKNT